MHVDGIYNLASVWSCGPASGTVCPTYHVTGDPVGLTEYNQAFASFAQEFAEKLAPAVRDDAHCFRYQTRRLTGGGPDGVEGEHNDTWGTAAAPSIPLYCSVLVNKQTEGGFEGHRGRLYVPYPGAFFLPGDLVDTAAAGLVAGAAAASWSSTWLGVTFTPVIFHASGATFHVVTGQRIANYATHRKWRAVNHFQSTL